MRSWSRHRAWESSRTSSRSSTCSSTSSGSDRPADRKPFCAVNQDGAMTGALRRCILALAIAALGSACTAAPAAPPVVRTDSAGIEIVRNTGEDSALEWSFEPVVRLGGADEGPQSFYRLSYSLIEVDRRGNLHVLDAASHRVLVFSADGRHLRTLGRKGSGPGELEWPAALDVSAGGTVSVRDISKPGLVQWDSAGTALTSEPLSISLYSDFSLVGNALVAPVRAPPSDDQVSRERLLVMRATDTTEIAVLALPTPAMLDFGCVGIMLPPRFSPSLVWGADERRIAVAVDVGYDVRLVEGEQESRIRREMPAREVTREMAIQDIGEGMTVGFGGAAPPCKVQPDVLIERQGFAPVLPAIGAIALSPDGSIWIRRGDIEGEPRIIDIFDAEGVYRGTLPPDSPFPAAFTPAGEIVAIEKDAMDIDHLVVYHVHRGSR